VDTTVLMFSLVVAALTAVLFGLAPALQVVRRDLVSPLRDAGKGSGGFRGGRLSSALVIAEIALSLVLLHSAGLLMRSVIKLQTASLGLDPEHVLFLRVPVGPGGSETAAQQQFLAQALTRLRALPGVVAASTTTGFPVFGGFGSDFDIPGIAHDERWRADIELCSDGYFRTLGMRLLQGRDFTADDLNGHRQIAVVNRALVERHLKNVDPIGRVIALKLRNNEGQLENRAFQIVGVVDDARNKGITNPPGPEAFLPYSASSTRGRGILVKTAGPPLALLSSVKREIWSIDRGVAISDAGAVTDYLRRFAYAEPRLGLFVFGAFAGIGLVLVILGVYSLIAYTVARQTREIGIRIAIGASRLQVLRMTLGMGVRWIGFGVAAGLLASLAASRVLTSQLWDVSPSDPLTLAAVVTVVVVSGFAASYVPAVRATRVDPMVALRYE
jgi:predicted permease